MVHARILKYLDEVVRCGSIRQAAEKLNIASSAINRQILDLEEGLGTPIFQRLPRGLRLTAAGEILIQHVRQTLKDYERVRERMLDLEGLRAGHVVVAVMNGPAEGFLPAVGLAFRRRFPGIKLTVRSEFSDGVLRCVESGDADLGLGYNLPPQHGLHVVQVFEATLGAVVAASHDLAARRPVRLSDCANYPLVVADPTLTISRILRLAFRRANLPLSPAFETNSVGMMKAIVRDGRHVTFLSQPDLRRQDSEGGLVFVPVTGAAFPRQPLSLVQRPNATLGLAASLFAEDLRRELTEILVPA